MMLGCVGWYEVDGEGVRGSVGTDDGRRDGRGGAGKKPDDGISASRDLFLFLICGCEKETL